MSINLSKLLAAKQKEASFTNDALAKAVGVSIRYIMAQESRDGKSLIVQSSKDQEMQNVRLTVTIVQSDQIPPAELGSIAIPAEYQVSDGK